MEHRKGGLQSSPIKGLLAQVLDETTREKDPKLLDNVLKETMKLPSVHIQKEEEEIPYMRLKNFTLLTLVFCLIISIGFTFGTYSKAKTVVQTQK